MSFSRVRAPGLWIPNSTVEPHEFEQIDRNLSRAVDGHGGGAIAPTNPIEVGGAGIRVLAPSHADQVTPKGWVENAIANEASARNAAISAQFSGCSARRTTNQTFLNQVQSPVLFDATDWDTGGYFNSVNQERLVAPSTGRYLLTWRFPFQSGDPGHRMVVLSVNGSEVGVLDSASPAAVGVVILAGALEVAFTSGDYLGFLVSQSSGGSLQLSSGQWGVRVSLRRTDYIAP